MNKTAEGHDVLAAVLLGIILLIQLRPISPDADGLALLLAGLTIALMSASVVQWLNDRKH